MTRAEQAYENWPRRSAYNMAEKDGFIAAFDAQQARIDELMLEFCPDEMEGAQMEEWEFWQRAAS